MAFLIKPKFPNVPKLPGVPQLLRSVQFPAGPPPILGAVVAIGRLWQALFVEPLWAIYKQQPSQPANDTGVETVTVVGSRTPVVVPDSFLAFNYRNEYTISDYPIQDGDFAAFNKVSNPFETFLRLSKGGSLQERKKFLDSLDAIAGTTDLYDILTPEKTYLGVNVLRIENSREGNRAAYFFAEVDVYFREIRSVVAAYSTTGTSTQDAQDPSATPTQNVGTVQGAPTPAAVTPDSVGIQPGSP